MIAVLWQGPYDAFSAVLVLLPLSISCWVYAQYHREQAAHRAAVRPSSRPSKSRTSTPAATVNGSAGRPC